jgi:hypothetical protein
LEEFYFSAEHRQWFFGTLIALVLLGQAFTVSVYVLRGVNDLQQLFETLDFTSASRCSLACW